MLHNMEKAYEVQKIKYSWGKNVLGEGGKKFFSMHSKERKFDLDNKTLFYPLDPDSIFWSDKLNIKKIKPWM